MVQLVAYRTLDFQFVDSNHLSVVCVCVCQICQLSAIKEGFDLFIAADLRTDIWPYILGEISIDGKQNDHLLTLQP